MLKINSLEEFNAYLESKEVKSKKKGVGFSTYYDICASFDTETTTFPLPDGEKASYVYAWSFSLDGELFMFGREPEDFFKFLESLNVKHKLIIYVQWLGYEYLNLQWLFDKYITKEKACFKKSLDRPIIIEGKKFIFKCSEMLSGKSLKAMGEDIKCYKSQDLDYSIPRNRLTPMTEEEVQYCLQDVNVVCKWVNNLKFTLDCKVSELPKTSAGLYKFELNRTRYNYAYRRKEASGKYKDWTEDDYYAFQKGMRGGLIVMNDDYMNEEISDVIHADIKSAYIYFELYDYENKNKVTFSEAQAVNGCIPRTFSKAFRRMCKEAQWSAMHCSYNFLSLAYFEFKNLTLKPNVPCCTLQTLPDKLKIENPVLIDDRVLSASKVEGWLTNWELYIIEMYYDYESVDWKDLYTCAPGSLRNYERDTIKKLFIEKENYKGTSAYPIKKIQLNSSFGFHCRRMDMNNIVRDGDDWKKEASTIDFNSKDYYYPVGCYIAARQRYRMAKIINELGDDFIYCNTDSIFAKNTPRAMKILNDENEAIKAGTIDDLELVSKGLGLYEIEILDKFRIIGPSRYYCERNGKKEFTFSGTTSKTITVDNFDDYVSGGEFTIEKGSKRVNIKKGCLKGFINGEPVETYNSLTIEDIDLKISNEKDVNKILRGELIS